ncbi:uncharacterized protein [Nicotiana tomentosiformis]|uniref:uncharacterized protein n=1 Tax=Nicotiana tomentosiformis TaxID=4098 RepID=UPI00388CCAF4
MPEDEQYRLERFGRLQPPSFSGAEGEDGFLDRCQRILRATGILETSGVSFTTFQFSEAAFSLWEAYERRKPVSTVPPTWQQFSVIFLEKFVSQNRREELRRQFEQLLQGDIFVMQYEMRFLELACHAICQERVEREDKRPRGHGGFSGAPSGARPVHYGASSGHGSHSYQQGRSSLDALPVQSLSCGPSGQGLSMPGPSASYPGARGSLQSPAPAPGTCYECGEFGLMRRECPRIVGGPAPQRSQPLSSTPNLPPPAQPAQCGSPVS